jgi:hypothetical protein
MKPIVHDSDLSSQLENIIYSFVKEKIEFIMKEELKNHLVAEHPDGGSSWNGYYQRTLYTRFGRIDELNVPRDRQGSRCSTVSAPRWIAVASDIHDVSERDEHSSNRKIR